MAVKKSIAIIGEGETEWWYFETLRVACRYKFKVAPDFPQHSDIPHMAKLAEDYVKRETDYVACLVDMDRLIMVPAEMATYQKLKKKSSRNVIWIETNPCTEFWFLLHFLPQLSMKHYDSCEDVLPDLHDYMPGYEKTARYFRKNNLYKYLTEHSDLQRAIGYAKELSRLSEATPKDRIAYSQMHRVFELIASMNAEETEEGKNPFSLDSKGPNWENFHDFLLGEVRYLSVKKAYPNEAVELFAEAQKMAQLRYKTYIRKSQRIGRTNPLLHISIIVIPRRLARDNF